MILVDIMPQGQTLSVQPHKNFVETFLQHNAQPRLKTQEAIKKVKRTLLPHPPHSPDIAAFHLFEVLKNAIHWKKFGSNNNVNEKVRKWL
jgi:hypothetical protein